MDSQVMPVDEGAPFLPAKSPYGKTKQDCEKLISESGVKRLLLRYFNPIGAIFSYDRGIA